MSVEEDVKTLSRSEVRYCLYRIQNGNPVSDEDGLKEHFEEQEWFDGWDKFAVNWDVGAEATWPNGQFVAVPLRVSMQEQWQRTVLGLAADPPKVEAPDTCTGETADGDPCGNKARDDGYCWLHTPLDDPDEEPENSGEDD